MQTKDQRSIIIKIELSRGNKKRSTNHSSQTSINTRQRTPSPSLITEKEREQTIVENNASSLVLNAAQLQKAVPIQSSSLPATKLLSLAEWATQRANGSFRSTCVWSKQMLMFDSAADQRIGSGPAWDIARCTDEIVNCFNHVENEDDPIVH